MKDTRIIFETAKLAKEKGFTQNPYKIPYSYRYEFTDNTGCVLSYSLFNPSSNICTAPSQSILAKWLREEHNLHISINVGIPHNRFIMYYSNVIKFGKHHKSKFKSEFYKTYEDAYEIGLQEALKLI